MDRWIDGQRIGLAAFCTRAYGSSPYDGDQRFHTKARRLLCSLLSAYQQKYEDPWLRTLPPSTLHMLTAISDATTGQRGLRQTAAKALNFLTEGDEPLTGRAQVLAHHIMHGVGPASRITRLGRSVYGSQARWRELERDDERMGQLALLLGTMRNGRSTAQERREATSGLARVLSGMYFLPQLENVLLHHVFCWPLLVYDSEEPTTRLAISLPVEVDVDFDLRKAGGKGRVILEGLDTVSGAGRDAEGRDWQSHLQEASEVARKLWRSMHGNYGDFRGLVQAVDVRFDFRWADAIAQDVVGRICLVDGSASAYFAQVVLSRLMGKRGYLSSAVTGLIGDQATHKDDTKALDFKFAWPGGLSEKVLYVFMSYIFERIVVPNDARSRSEIESLLAGLAKDNPASAEPRGPSQSAEVIHVGRLSNLADVVQVEGWRKTNYIRCPEVAWAVHSDGRPGLIDSGDPRVVAALERLRRNDACVIRMDDSTPLAIASALWHINRERLPTIEPYPPPGLSYAFIRTIYEEQDARFWRVLWRIMGAPEEEFEAFHHSPSTEIAVKHLARALNRFVPDLDRLSHRAPDVVVIIGTERFAESRERNKCPLSRPLAAARILEVFERENALRISESRRTCPELYEYVGRTRLVLLPDGVESEKAAVLPPLQTGDREVLQALATFRWEFTQQMAALLLAECGIKGVDVRNKLIDLTKAGFLRYGLGRYHLSPGARGEVRRTEDVRPESEGRRQFAAGIALAPYVVGAEMPGLAYDRAFLPENVHEAGYHLARAFNLYDRAGKADWRRGVRNAQLRHCRFADMPGWNAVLSLNQAMTAGKDAYEMAMDLIQGWKDHPDNKGCIPPHPNHLKNAVIALKYWDGVDNSDEIEALCREALDLCSQFPSEEAFCRLDILVVYADYLAKHRPERVDELAELDRQILELEPYWDRLRGEWFERVGDREADHGRAAQTYLLGLEQAPEWQQLWLKSAGALTLAGSRERLRELETLFDQMTEERAADVVRRSYNAFVKDKKSAGPWKPVVDQRWERGLEVFGGIWRQRSYDCRRLLDKYGPENRGDVRRTRAID